MIAYVTGWSKKEIFEMSPSEVVFWAEKTAKFYNRLHQPPKVKDTDNG